MKSTPPLPTAVVNQVPSAIAAAIVLVLYVVADWHAAAANPWLWSGMLAIAAATYAALSLPWES